MRRLRIFTWHVHGNYLWYLSQVRHDFYLPVQSGGGPGYNGRGHAFPFGANVHEVPVGQVPSKQFDCILFQGRQNYEIDQFNILTPVQQQLPRIHLEHDPPREHPTDTRHFVSDPNVLVVHVTPFNALMWDNGDSPVRVIEHGAVVSPEVRYLGQKSRGVVVINNLRTRGRRLGCDIFEKARDRVPLDLVGTGSDEIGGIGEIPPTKLTAVVADYRFFFNPIRYTSLGLSVVEAMSVGMPIVALATTEMATVVQNGINGFADTDVHKLIAAMHELIDDAPLAKRLGENARQYALERFGIDRFVREWERTFADVTTTRTTYAARRPVKARGLT